MISLAQSDLSLSGAHNLCSNDFLNTTLTVLQIKQAGLTHIFDFRAGLTNFCLLKPHPGSRTPSEHRERPGTYLTLLPIFLLHLQIHHTLYQYFMNETL